MQIEQELAKFSPGKDTLLTIGVFDGVHLGHKYLIARLKELAKERGLLSGVVTFSQHPVAVLSPQTELLFLTDLDQRIEHLKNEGVDAVVPIPFNLEVAQLSAREFVGLLKKCLRMRGLVVGYDFALGRDREGNSDTLHKLGKEMNFTVAVVPPMINGGEIVSSTAVRKALAEGNMKRVQKLSGRLFSLKGRVVTGSRRGIELGFPTANLSVNSGQALPKSGVYVTRAHIDDKIYPSVTNIGFCPTFGGTECTIEVHILDYQGDLYQHEMRIDIVERLRDEKKFDSPAELKKQIAEDIKQSKAILDSRGSN